MSVSQPHRLAVWLLVLGSSIAPHADAQHKPVYAGFGSEELDAWTNARIKAANTKKPEVVRLPITHKSLGWGCVCPENYIGGGPDGGGDAWLKLETAPHVELLPPGRFGWTVMAEGRFTGQTDTFVWRDGKEVMERYTLHVFRVERWRRIRNDEDMDAIVVLDGADAAERLQPLADDRPWLVIGASIERHRPKARARADTRRDAFKAAGYSQAEVIDSRALPRLFCCFYTVVLSRHKTKAEAVAASKAARRARGKARVKSYVRLGWGPLP